MKVLIGLDSLFGLVIGVLGCLIFFSLVGCSTTKPVVVASPSLPSVPCAIEHPIQFAAPRNVGDVKNWTNHRLFGTEYDTPETVRAIREHNAEVEAICHGE